VEHGATGSGITIDCALIVGLVFDGVRGVILSTTLFAVSSSCGSCFRA